MQNMPRKRKASTQIADLETLERVAAGLALKYKADEAAATPEESPEPPAEETQTEAEAAPEEPPAAGAGEANGPGAKFGSRWRLALRDRPVPAEAE